MNIFIKYHLPALLYAGLILVLSSIPNWGPKQEFIIGVDKIIHFFEYALFAFFIYRSFSHISPYLSSRLVIFASLVFVALFSGLDEYYQSHIPGRESDIFDALFDILGASLIVLVLALRKDKKQKQ